MAAGNTKSCLFCGGVPKDGIIVKIRSSFLVHWLVSRAVKKDYPFNVR